MLSKESKLSKALYYFHNSKDTELFHKLCIGELTGNYSVSEEN